MCQIIGNSYFCASLPLEIPKEIQNLYVDEGYIITADDAQYFWERGIQTIHINTGRCLGEKAPCFLSNIGEKVYDPTPAAQEKNGTDETWKIIAGLLTVFVIIVTIIVCFCVRRKLRRGNVEEEREEEEEEEEAEGEEIPMQEIVPDVPSTSRAGEYRFSDDENGEEDEDEEYEFNVAARYNLRKIPGRSDLDLPSPHRTPKSSPQSSLNIAQTLRSGRKIKRTPKQD